MKNMCVFNSNSSVQDEERTCHEQCELLEEWNCEECPIKEAFNRLAAYEDTGLTPEEVEALKVDNDRLHRLIDEMESGLRKESNDA